MGRRKESFWDKVAIAGPNDCWLWQRALLGDGYGNFDAEGKTRRAHRHAYELTNGPIPEGMLILHKCDVRACCNPAHLFLGTSLDNAQDRKQKGRNSNRAGAENQLAKLTDAQVRTIREMHATKEYTQKELADTYGVSTTTIRNIVKRKAWTHV